MPSLPWSQLMILADVQFKTNSLNLFNDLAKCLDIFFLGQDFLMKFFTLGVKILFLIFSILALKYSLILCKSNGSILWKEKIY